jgi:phage shock protein PspC (stress-responsive transcriptional regulator)
VTILAMSTTSPEPEPRRLVRSSSDRVIGGVCGGLAEYFSIDPIIVRLAAVGLAVLGGVGVLVYLAALLLVPEDGGEPRDPSRTRTIAGLAVLVLAGLVLLPAAGFLAGGVVFPLALLAGLGLLAWWLSAGGSLSGTPREVAQRIGGGLGILLACALILVGGVWAGAAGGGTVAAIAVIAAGLVIVAAAFARPARWLILPTLSLALGVGVAAAAGIDTADGVGEREYRPATAAQLRDRYELGAGQLVLDLRHLALTGAQRRVELDVGIGRAVVLVPRDACVSVDSRVGAGDVRVFGRDHGGVDVDFDDHRAGGGLLIDGEVGLGQLAIGYDWDDVDERGPWHDGDDARPAIADCA